MSGDQGYPPPGAPPPPGGPPPPGWQPPPEPARAPWPVPQWAAGPPRAFAPGMLGAAHKPGAMPLRPLGLGDIYDAAFRIIRFNPKATVGSAVLVTAASMAIPILVTAVLTILVDFTADSGDLSSAEAASIVGSFGSFAVGSILQSVGLVLVTGMIAHVTAAAAIGRRLTLGEAWAATRGSRWRLIGLTLLLALMTTGIVLVYVVAWVVVALALPTWAIVVFGLVSAPAFLAFLLWFWIRVYYLPVPALMIERTTVFRAIGRGFRLTSRQYWRTFGIGVLTLIIVQIAAGVLAFPFTLGGQLVGSGLVSSQWAPLISIVLLALGSVVGAAFTAPFTAAVTSLQYLDQRMRKEAYDVELMTQAGITAS